MLGGLSYLMNTTAVNNTINATRPLGRELPFGPEGLRASNGGAERPSAMEALLAAHPVAIPKVGDIVRGQVLSAAKHEVQLDIPGLTIGVVRGRELIDESGQYGKLAVGDEVEATVVDVENERGELELSFRQAGHRKAWDELGTLARDKTIVDATVVDANRGGLMVRVNNIVGFLPVSQLTVEHYPRVEGGDKEKILERLASYVGQTFRVRILDFDERDDKLILSEKLAWEEKSREQLAAFTVGATVEGTVTGVVNFGAFIEFGAGLEGLVHISELAWQRIDDPRQIVKPGQQVTAQIISLDGGRVSLSLKRLQEDPWKAAAQRYQVGQVVEGTVLKINPFGVFVELDSEIHGLCHISELSSRIVRDPGEVVKAGEKRPFKILSIEPGNHRLGLSIKALEQPTEPAAPAVPDTTEAPPVSPAPVADNTTVNEPVAPSPAGAEASAPPA